jgi:spermidine synthase
MQSVTLLAYLVTFTASFCVMVIELVAGRIMAPYIGMHLYSWTSIIGVCLAGISFGALLGGWLADKFPRRSTLGWFLFLSGLLTIVIPMITDSLGYHDPVRGYVSLMVRIVVYTSLIFLPAALMLGMISPMAIRLLIRDLSNAGSVVGRIYAFSTIGSIIGTFATGFFLIEELGTRLLLYCVGALLIVISPLVGGLLGRSGKPVGASLLVMVLALLGVCLVKPNLYTRGRDFLKNSIGQPFIVEYEKGKGLHLAAPYDRYIHTQETNYYTLKVLESQKEDIDTGEGRILYELILDNLIHSHSDPTDPRYLEYEYLRIYEELVDWKLERKGTTQHRELFIGGGGYTLQRYFHNVYPDCHIDVVEIDPGVTQVAEEYMGAPKNDPRLVTYNEDGRLFVKDMQNSPTKYDFIFGDAFNDLSIPFHLTTLEFDTQLKNMMTDKGLLMALVIDNVGKGLFLPSYLRTAAEAFGEQNVALVIIEKVAAKDLNEIKHSTVIVVASKSPQDFDDFERFLKERQATKDKSITSHVIRPAEVQNYLKTRTREPNWLEKWFGRTDPIPWTPVLLTDDYAPVDNLTAPMFEQRYGYQKK